MGIFGVLLAAGLGDVLTSAPSSLDVIVGPLVALVWSVTLVVFGALGLVACILPRQMVLLGLGLELAARIALAFGAASYGVAVGFALGFSGRAAVTVCTFLGIAVLHFAAALTITHWLRRRRQQVTIILAEQSLRHEDEGDPT